LGRAATLHLISGESGYYFANDIRLDFAGKLFSIADNSLDSDGAVVGRDQASVAVEPTNKIQISAKAVTP
jgi:hypothetical protein